jgi:DNA-binding protein YbaB
VNDDIAKQLLARIEAIDTASADNNLRAESYQRMAEQLAGTEGRATSQDGMVTVVAGANGTVESITFTEQIRNTTPKALAASVLHTIAQARALAARQQAEVIRSGLGDTDLLDRVLDSDERLFGDRRPQDPGPAPTAAPSAAAPRTAPPAGRAPAPPATRQPGRRAVPDYDEDDDYFENLSGGGWTR